MFPHRARITFAPYLAVIVALILLGLLWVYLPAPAIQAQSQPDALGSVSGTIRNAQGDPLPEMVVWLEQYRDFYAPRSVTTNTQGDYHFASVLPGIYRLKVVDSAGIYAESYYLSAPTPDKATTFNVGGNEVGDIDVTLQRGGSISATIISDQPITMPVDITLYRQAADGRWQNYRTQYSQPRAEEFVQIGGLPFGRYRLCLSMASTLYAQYYSMCYDNVLPASGTFPAANGEDIVIDDTNPVAVTFDFTSVSQLRGTVLAPNNEPLTGIRLWVEDLNGLFTGHAAVTDEQGHFRFGHLPESRFVLIANVYAGGEPAPADYPGRPYLPVYYPNDFGTGAAQTLNINSSSRISVTMKLTRGGQISGTATLPDGVPLVNPIIRAHPNEADNPGYTGCSYLICYQSSYDPATGAYTLTHLLPGKYLVSAEQFFPNSGYGMTGYYGGTTEGNADQVTVFSGRTTQNINVVIGDTGFDGVVTGTISADGVPQAGMIVGLHNGAFTIDGDYPTLTTTTDAQGNYALTGLAAGMSRISVSDPSGRYAKQFYEPSPNETAFFVSGIHATPDINIALVPAGAVRGQIHTPENESPAGYHIIVLEPVFQDDSGIPSYYGQNYLLFASSGEDGRYELTGLKPNLYIIAARPPDVSIFPPDQRYYPGTFDQSRAMTVTVEAGEVTEGIDIAFGPLYDANLPYIRGGDGTTE